MLHDPSLIVVLFADFHRLWVECFIRTFVSFITFEVQMIKHSNMLCWKEVSLRQTDVKLILH